MWWCDVRLWRKVGSRGDEEEERWEGERVDRDRWGEREGAGE